MHPFTFEQPPDTSAALKSAARQNARFLAGGTNLLDLMKGGIEQPQHVIDITALPLAGITELPDGGVRIGALARNSDVANHPLIRTRYPLLSQALLSGATPQLRNMATVGGNLMQRTRCYYFTDAGFAMCNKRVPNSGCAAREGENRIHAIFGASDACIATNPSDMNVALAALEAIIQLRTATGARSVPFNAFHRLPGDTPSRDTNLAPGELILAVDLPLSPFADRSHYLKVRDRASYAFALVSVAAALHVDNGAIRAARLALGGVAHKPWRAFDAENALIGKTVADATFQDVAKVAVRDARPYRDNAFKVGLAERAIVRALQTAADQRA